MSPPAQTIIPAGAGIQFSAIPMTTLTITRGYTTQYADPIRFKAGETIALTGRVDTWEDHADWVWLWAIAPDGREGWIPADVVDAPARTHIGTARARRDYDARELTVLVGEKVELLETAGGWHLCRAADGRTGWVPVSHTDDES